MADSMARVRWALSAKRRDIQRAEDKLERLRAELRGMEEAVMVWAKEKLNQPAARSADEDLSHTGTK